MVFHAEMKRCKTKIPGQMYCKIPVATLPRGEFFLGHYVSL
jgi:hypothetical protein